MPSRAQQLRWAVRLIGPLLLLVVIWRVDDKAALWRSIREADGLLLAMGVLLNAPIVHLKIERWRAFLAARGYRYSLRPSYAAVLASVYLGMVTPGHVGEVVRVQYAHRDIGLPYTEGLASTMIDRFCDLYVLAAVVAMGTVYLAAALDSDLVLVSSLAVVLAIVGPSLLLVKGPAELVGRAVGRLSARWQARLQGLFDSLRSMAGRTLLLAIPLTVAAYAIGYAQGWLLGRALGIELGYLAVASLLATTSLLGLLPITVSGVGVRELFLALVFPALGLTGAAGVAFGLVVFACNYLVIVVAGFIAWQLAPPPVDTRASGR